MKSTVVLVAVGLGLAISASVSPKPALGRRVAVRFPAGEVDSHTDFAILQPPSPMRVGPRKDSRRTLTGTSIAETGDGFLVIDDETGTLSLLGPDGAPRESVNIGKRAGLLAVDRIRQEVFVADRAGDGIEVLRYGAGLSTKLRIPTAAEPYGVALSPDGVTLLVTTVAGRKLQAFAAESGEALWSLDIGPEARAVAISPGGAKAVVSFLGSGAIARVDLATRHLRFESIGSTRTASAARANLRPAFHVPESHARNVFAATFVGDTAVVAYQRSTPKAVTSSRNEERGTYGGGGRNPPIVHRLALMPSNWNSPGRVHVRMHMPRALAYDVKRDELLIADMANEQLILLEHTSTAMRMGRRISLRSGASTCGPSGVATTDGGDIAVHCSLSKRIAIVDRSDGDRIQWSPVLSLSMLSTEAQRGRVLFHKGGDARLSSRGSMACANCHPEARNDGLSWRIEGKELQTPLLAGRMKGTHPFKWDGQDADLHTSLMHTVVRLGGVGIAASDASDLQAYLESTEPIRVVASSTLNAQQNRGKELFDSKELGCRTCHSGANYSDGALYDLGDDMDKVNTPSLVGLAASAPYYHDGSAPSLRALVLGNGSVRGMGNMEMLDDKEVDDLIAFLETL